MIGKILVLAALSLVEAKKDPISLLLKECLKMTSEYGTLQKNGVTYVSNLSEIINQLQRNALFTRNTDLYICHDDNYIHGIRVVLQHDEVKDPEYKQLIDNFYEEDDPYFEQKFYEHMIGSNHGACSNVHFESGVKLQTLRIEHDDEAIHKLEFQLTDGTKKIIGGAINETSGNSAFPKKYESRTFNFGEDG